MKNYSDEDRMRLAKEERGRVRGPWETAHCEHGKLYSYRWTWDVGGDVESGDVESGKHGCKQCNKEDES